ncbi:MAG: hypothetical protein DCC65_09660 [Planctomycetota bacterium]|nr:MAG: hypothetical protein DCC65_09660 [Planctomycetota bacterium]
MSAARMNLAVTAVVVAISAAFGLGAVRPGLKELEDRRAKLDAEAMKVREQQAGVGDIGRLYAAIVDLDRAMQDFRSRLPADRQFGEFLNAIAENIRSSGIEDYIVEPQSPRRIDESKLPEDLEIVKGTTVLPVRVAFECGFGPALEFLDRMENLTRLSHVESLRMVNLEEQPGRVRVEVTLHTYSNARD